MNATEATGQRTPSARPNYRRRRIVAFGIAGVVLAGAVAGTGYVTSALAAPVPAVAPSIADMSAQSAALLQQAAAPVWPGYGAGALGVVGSDSILTSHGEQGVVPIASITKVVTALVILDVKPLAAGEVGPDIEYTDDDVDIYYDELNSGGSVAPVVSGLVLNERQSLEALMLASGNNYSISLAVWAFGSMDAFLEAANAWLAENGFASTHLADSSGVSPESASTVSDLIALGKLALAHPVLAEIVAMTSTDLPVIGVVENTNQLLGELGVNGLKTGTTEEAGACLMFSSEFVVGSETITVVGVLLGGDNHPDLDDDIRAILTSVQSGFHEVSLVEAGASVASYETVWGQSANAITTEAASTVVWSDTPIVAAIDAATVELADKGSSVGSVSYSVGEKIISVPLVLDADIDDPGAEWRLGNPGVLAKAGENAQRK